MNQETHSVIQGSFVDYKRYVRQNKTIFHIEVPIEYTNKYISILGEPTAAEPISVAVARLQNDIPAVNLSVIAPGEGGEGGENGLTSVNAALPTNYDYEIPDYWN